ncbi:MAG: hypothetical protein PHR36_02485 [Patescibacteria group bacterium]|nr:hypothetical protein [Patescibacteria group bacterium]
MSPLSKEAISVCRDFGFNAIELGVTSLADVSLLEKITKKDLANFKYISIHGPGHDVMRAVDAKEHKRILDIFQRIYKKLNFNCLVLHPGEWIADWEIFKNYSFPIAFENMDWRHKIASDVKGLKEIFSHKNFKMVLDLNHCYTHDPTLKLAADIYKEFKNIIRHYHLSGIGQSDHDPLYRSQGLKIIKAIPNLNLPIIIECKFKDLEDARKEAEYVKRELRIKI